MSYPTAHIVQTLSLIHILMINKARSNPKRIVFAEGEDLKILSAIEEISGEGIAHPILIGNKAIILRKIKENKLNIPTPDIFDPQAEQNTLEKYTELYYAPVSYTHLSLFYRSTLTNRRQYSSDKNRNKIPKRI